MDAAVVARALVDAAGVLDPAVLAAIRGASTGGTPPAGVLVERPHGTVVGFIEHRARPWRVIEIDRHGTLLAALRWRDDALAEATLRIPDGRWVTIEAGATDGADRLWVGSRPGLHGPEPLATFAALDYASIGEIPALADPTRLPPGAGTTVLNLLAGLARDGSRRALPYRGPYPTEQLFLSLLESFRYVDSAGDDPLAAFTAGGLAWDPAPHERRIERDVVVQLRDRVEKVVWGRRTYYRADWQTVRRHAPRRVHDAGGDVVCSLWILGAPIEDHLRLTRDGALLDVVAPALAPDASRALAPDTARAVVATVAATTVPALAPFVRECGRALLLEWGAVDRDLLAVDGSTMRISTRVRATAIERLAGAGDRAGRITLAFVLLGELAALLGDALRGAAQALLAGRPVVEQEAALAMVDDPERAAAAAVIGRGIEALLDDLGAAT